MKLHYKSAASGMIVMLLVLALSASAWQPSQAAGDTIYVDADASGAADGSTWADAFTDLQSALDVAVSGNQIWVAEGDYKPTIEHEGTGDRYKSFQMKNGVAIYGGFNPSAGDTAWEDRDWETNLTILSGDLNGDDEPYFTNYTDNSYHVFYHPSGTNLDGSAILDGFTIIGGWANGTGTHNQGGGMYNYYCSPTLTNVVFMLNYANFGGGMFNDNGSEPVLTRVTFSANMAGPQGGGMANYWYSSPSLTGIIFIDNVATAGGGIYNYYRSSPILTNAIFSGNSAGFEGGGMCNSENSDPILTNVTFAANVAGIGVGLYNDSSNPTLTNAIFWGGSSPQIYNAISAPDISYSDIYGGCPSGAICDHVMNLDPQFVDAASGDLRLQLTSPAIDAGDNSAVPAGITTDLDGSLRFFDVLLVLDTGNGTAPIVDMGAYETHTETIAPTVAYILRNDPDPTIADQVDFTVSFSEDVTGVGMGDFNLYTTGSLSGCSVTNVTGSGSLYTVTISIGNGLGTLRLDIPDSATITDLVGNPLSGLPYENGESYTILQAIYLPLIVR